MRRSASFLNNLSNNDSWVLDGDSAGTASNTGETSGGTGKDNDKKSYMLYEINSPEFVTFVTVKHPDTLLVVRNIQHRLVITLPNTIHNLKHSRFFMVLKGAGHRRLQNGLYNKDNTTYGNLVFHQDQPHINLFVFFSVFFSCFFLFLAVCVLIWKSKQSVDLHRSRHRQRLQMEHMASRPFARVLVELDPSTTPLVQDVAEEDKVVEEIGAIGGGLMETVRVEDASQTKVQVLDTAPSVSKSKEGKKARLSGKSRKKSLEATSPSSMQSLLSITSTSNSDTSGACSNAGLAPVLTQQPAAPSSSFPVAPIALEPTEDGIATVATVLLQLPGGVSAPMQLCMASALISMRVHCPGNSAGGTGEGGCGSRGDNGRHGGKVSAVIHHRGSSTA